jgi:hypothetical protein
MTKLEQFDLVVKMMAALPVRSPEFNRLARVAHRLAMEHKNGR